MKVLFLVPYPTEGASNRVRVEQFIPYLESQGMRCAIRPFVTRRFFKVLYHPHHYLEKALFVLICTINRLLDILRAMRYDMIFVHREAYPFGGPFLEAILYRMKKPIIFDFDDAIFLPNTSEYNIYIDRFKKPDKVFKIIKMSQLVIAGNSYLKDCVIKYNSNVTIIPSSVDTEIYRPSPKAGDKTKIVIGWIGSNTTKNFLYDIEPALIKLSNRYKNLAFKIVGARFYSLKLNNIINKEWALKDELDDIRSFDIGIMPMPDNEWTRGKCAFKAILYMSCGLPVVASPTGVNVGIIEDQENGFLAKGSDEWVDRLSLLIEDEALRRRFGAKGREKIVKYYSVEANAPKLLDSLRATYHDFYKRR